MKYTYLRAFEQHLKGAAPDNFGDVYLILSKDEFERRVALEKLLPSLLGGDDPQLRVRNFDGTKLNTELLSEELNSPSLFSSKMIVIIKNGEKIKKAVSQVLVSHLANLSVCLVIVAESMDMRTTLYKKLEKNGIVFAPAQEKPWEKKKRMASWIFQEISDVGKKISPAVADAFVEQLGSDGAIMQQELSKLICYVGDRSSISIDDVQKISSKINLQTVWLLGEAILQRDCPSAIKIGRSLLDDGSDILSLVIQVRSQLRKSFQIYSIISGGGAPQEVSREFPYMRGKILDKNIKLSLNYGANRFSKGVTLINDLELQLKSQDSDPSLSLEILLVKLCR